MRSSPRIRACENTLRVTRLAMASVESSLPTSWIRAWPPCARPGRTAPAIPRSATHWPPSVSIADEMDTALDGRDCDVPESDFVQPEDPAFDNVEGDSTISND
jgi:hypothetical protein